MDEIKILKDSDLYFEIPDLGDERGRDVRVYGEACLFKVTTSDGTVFDYRDEYVFETKGGEVTASKYDWTKRTPFGDDFNYIVTQTPMITDKDNIKRWNEDTNDYEIIALADAVTSSDDNYEVTWDKNYKGLQVPLLKINDYTFINRPLSNKTSSVKVRSAGAKIIFNIYYGDSAFNKDSGGIVSMADSDSGKNYNSYKFGESASSGRWYSVVIEIDSNDERTHENIIAVRDNTTGDIYLDSDAEDFFYRHAKYPNVCNSFILDDDDEGHPIYVSSFLFINKNISTTIALALASEICPTELGG